MQTTLQVITLSLILVFGSVTAPIPQKPQLQHPNPYIQPGAQPTQIAPGHRLITRALWRIFDALMEKKNSQELYGRINVVEGALNNLLTDDTKFKRDFSDMKGHIHGYRDEIATLQKEVDKIKDLDSRVKQLEEWQLKMERQSDENDSPLKNIQPAFSSCPDPFEAVGGECFHVVLDKKLSWREGRRDCARLGGDLASPRDVPQFRNYLRNLPGVKKPEYAWVGLSRTEEDVWIWATGNQVGHPADMTQETWNVDLPQGMGDCGGLFELAGFRAYDYKCEEKDNFICQYFF